MRKKIMIYAASMALGSLMMFSCSSSDDEGFDEEKKLVNMVANVIPVKLTAEPEDWTHWPDPMNQQSS